MNGLYTHLHFRYANGLAAILPMDDKGLGFAENPDGTASMVCRNGTDPTKEKFADVLERMTDAGLCLQLGSTAPIGSGEKVVNLDPHLRVSFSPERVEELQRIIRSQDDELSSLRALSREVEDTIDLVRKSSDVELQGCADVAGGISRVVWGLMLIAIPRGVLLREGLEHARERDARIAALETGLERYALQETAAVTQLRQTAVALRGIKAGGIDKWAEEQLGGLADVIVEFLDHFYPAKPEGEPK